MAPKLTCTGCKSPITGREYMKCLPCGSIYDLDCANLSSVKFRAMTENMKRDWKCPGCLCNKPKTDNDNTPVRTMSPTGSAENIKVARRRKPRPNSPDDDVDDEIDPNCLLRRDFQSFQESILSRLDNWFKKNNDTVSELSNNFKEIKESIRFISDKYDDLLKKTEEVTSHMSTLENRIEICSLQEKRIHDLELQVDLMEQQLRECNIEISNVPDRRGENLIDVVTSIGVAIKHPIMKEDIISAHRVPSALPTSPRPKNIIVKLRSRVLRDNIISAARLHKGVTTERLNIGGRNQKIYINEHLTLKRKLLFRNVREAAKSNGYLYVWIKHGIILTRANDTSPVIAIRSKNDISKIKSLK